MLCKDKSGIVMKEYYKNQLYSGSGKLVVNVNQAKAIAMAEQRKCERRKV